MKREVLTSKDIKSGSFPKVLGGDTVPTGKDQYVDRLLKYIPAEIVALYIFILGILQRLAGGGEEVIHWIVFAVFCILTYLYLRKMLHVAKLQQLIISVLAYAVWVFALGGPFALYADSWYNPIYGQIILPIFTFAIALVEAEK